MRRLPAMLLLGVIALFGVLGAAGALSAEAVRAGKRAPEAGVQTAAPFVLVVAAGRTAPRKLPCPYCPKKQKHDPGVCTPVPCATPSLAPLPVALLGVADAAAVAIAPQPARAGIARPPDPPPPKS